MKTILASVDLSDISSRVLATAVALARSTGAKLRLVHVIAPDPDFVGMEVGPSHEREWKAEDIRERRKLLRSLAEEVEGVDIDEHVVQGRTVDSILDQAESCDADLIVVGSHGHGALYRAIVGSTSEGVLRNARVPVLVVPGKRKRG